MARRVERTTASRSAMALDEERKAALANLRAQRSQGAANLNFGCKLDDVRQLIDGPALGCGVAAYLGRLLRDPKKLAALRAEGEEIYAQMRGVPRRGSGETVLYLDPSRAEGIAMALAGAGLRLKARQAGWAVFRGPAEIGAVRALLHELGLSEDAYRLDEIAAFVPPPDNAEADLPELPEGDTGPSEGVHADSGQDDQAECEAASPVPLLDDEERVGSAGSAPSVAEPKEAAADDLDHEVERSADASAGLDHDARGPRQSPTLPPTRTTLEGAQILLGLSYAPPDAERSDASSPVSYEGETAPGDTPPRRSSEAAQGWNTVVPPSPADADLAWTKRGEA